MMDFFYFSWLIVSGATMEFYEVIDSRNTVRQFLDREVERDRIEKKLDAGNC